jgi:hypothetical protein
MRKRVLIAATAATLLSTGTAQAAVPTVTTRSATSITQVGAKLTGAVNPNKAATTWHFEYGTTPTFGTSTPEQAAIPAGTKAVNVSLDIGGLVAGTTYYYRLVATNSSGAAGGKGKSFATNPAVSVATQSPIVPFGGSATINGQVFGTAVSGITITLQENPYPFAGFAEVATTKADAGGHYQFIRPVTANTAYRVVTDTKPAGVGDIAFVYEQDTVTLKVSRAHPRRGKSVVLSGFASPARVGVPIEIQRLGKNGWRTVLKALPAPTSTTNVVSFAARLRKVVTGLYRAVAPGGWDHLAGIGSPKRIAVR